MRRACVLFAAVVGCVLAWFGIKGIWEMTAALIILPLYAFSAEQGVSLINRITALKSKTLLLIMAGAVAGVTLGYLFNADISISRCRLGNPLLILSDRLLRSGDVDVAGCFTGALRRFAAFIMLSRSKHTHHSLHAYSAFRCYQGSYDDSRLTIGFLSVVRWKPVSMGHSYLGGNTGYMDHQHLFPFPNWEKEEIS